MTDNEDQIRTLIEQWAEAVHPGDMDDVLADHAHDCAAGRDRSARRSRRTACG
jgi:ketosteroid isomerase-like protein